MRAKSLGVKNVVTTIEREVVSGRYSSNIPLDCAIEVTKQTKVQ